jgi:ABC-2 type transport system permease protein
MGDPGLLLLLLAGALVLLAASASLFSRRFADFATAAAGLASARARQRLTARPFRNSTPAETLRRKEWVLLLRDPWLMSQTLIQILYLLPPALLLWRNFGEGAGALSVLVPVVVMAAGQLAGGLAWLAVSGEDAPDLVASAPVPAQRVLWAKIEAVTGGIAVAVLPLIFFLVLASPFDGIVCVGGVLVAAASATLIQLWFRTQAKRSHFRRRQTSSRIATFAEALSSISWAGTAFLLTASSWLALIPGTAAVCVLAAARAIRPR